ncbi:MAG: hypothetical protein Q9219_004355 [cf. Caloplaca sp. 3 TL-2023]
MLLEPRGALIVIEGLDRAGKSTQSERLVQALQRQGHRSKRMRFPDRSTPIGKSIDTYLKGETDQEDHAVHLLFSANRWEAVPHIREAILHGTTIIIDRYYYSGIVYSAAKNKPDLSLKWAAQPDIGLPKPDLCIFLDISPRHAAARGGFGCERYETSEMQGRVRTLFQELLNDQRNSEMVSVDAGRSMDEVHGAMLQLASNVLKDESMRHPLQTFLGV